MKIGQSLVESTSSKLLEEIEAGNISRSKELAKLLNSLKS